MFVKQTDKTILHMLLAAVVILLAAMDALGCQEQTLQKAIDQAVQQEMQRQEAVGVAIGVIRDGKVFHTSGHGWADRAQQVPVKNNTLFRWASISKPLTAIVAMQLVEQDKLDLDADIRLLVPEFPDKGTPITMRQLLGHLGGIVHYGNGRVVRTKRNYKQSNPYKDVILALDRFKESPLVAEPGAAYAYTTHGYILASAVAQRSGKAPYHLQVRDRISRPLKLKTLQPDYQWRKIPGRAVGYRKKQGEIIPSTDTDVSWKLGGGGWISNVDDLASFAAGLMGDELVTPETKKVMWTRQRNNKGDMIRYGLGFRVSSTRNGLQVMHSGSQEKTRTQLTIYPDQGHGVVVMTNSEYADPDEFTKVIYKAINDHAKRHEPPNDK